MRVSRPWSQTLRFVLLIGLLLAVLLAAATWAALQQLDRVSTSLKVVSAAAAALVPVLGTALVAVVRDGLGRRGDLHRQMEDSFRFWRRRGGPRVRDIANPYLLGVHQAAAIGHADYGGAPPPYVRRTRDAELETALREAPFVLLIGASTAGKSRSAYEAMRRCLPDHLLLVPAARTSIGQLDRMQIRLPTCVIWLDEIDRYLGEGGLDEHLLDRLTSSDHGAVTLLGTIRSSKWEEYSADDELHRSDRELLHRAHRIRIERRFDDDERVAAEERAGDRRIAAALSRLDRYGLAEYLAVGPALLEKLLNAVEDVQPVGAALVRAAVDWHRAGLARPVPRPALERLCAIYVPHGGHTPTAEEVAAGLKWATERVLATAALLAEEREGYVAFDYVVDHYASRAGEFPIPSRAWRLLLTLVTDPTEASAAGMAAYFAERPAIAEEWFRAASEGGSAHGRLNLGILLGALGRSEEAIAVLDEVDRRFGDAQELAVREQVAKALVNKGVTLSQLGRLEEATAVYDEVDRRFRDAQEPALREPVARALVNKGFTLSRSDEAIAVYDEVDRRFRDAQEPALREAVARALVNKGSRLGRLARSEDAITVFSEVDRRFRDAREPALRELVATALRSRGFGLSVLGRSEEAMAAYDEVDARFRNAQEPALREAVAAALVNKGVTLSVLRRFEEAIAIYDEIAVRFRDAQEPALREQVAMALRNKGVALGQLGRFEEAIAAYDEVEYCFRDAQEPALREQVAQVLVNKGITLGDLGRSEEAIAAYDEVDRRFGDAQEPALREQVATALVNKGFRLGELGRSEEAISVDAEVDRRFRSAQEPALRVAVAAALVNKGVALGELGRSEEAMAAYDEVEHRFGDAQEPALTKQVARARIRRALR